MGGGWKGKGGWGLEGGRGGGGRRASALEMNHAFLLLPASGYFRKMKEYLPSSSSSHLISIAGGGGGSDGGAKPGVVISEFTGW